jgi:PAS domain S-box-containing protein
MMAKEPDGITKVTGLPRQAEALLRATKCDVAAMPVEDVQQLVHALQIKQIELNKQNEELRRTQVELEAARDRYVALYDFSPAGHLTLDASGTIVESNLRAATLLGLNRQELIGQPLARFVEAEDQGIFQRHCLEVVKLGTRQTCEMQFRNESGVSRWLYLESLAVQEEPERITHWQTVLLDITERKRAAHAKNEIIRDLSRSQQHFQTLFNWTPSAIGISTVAEGRFIDVNDEFSRLTGYAREEVIGRTTVELGLWADPSERAIVLQEMRERGRLHNREGQLRTKAGEIRALMVSVESIQLGSTPCLIYLAHDMTERKRTEEALRLAKFSMERAADAVYWIDPQARILDVNEAAVLMLGYSKDELCAMTVHDLNPDFQADMWPGFWADTQRRGTMVVETVHRTKDGRLVPIEVSVNYLAYEGKEYHCAFVRNITERKRTEELWARFAAIVEGSDDAIIGKDLHGIITTWNQGAQQLFGYTAQETITRSVSILVPPDRVEEERHIQDQITRGERIQPYDTVRRRKDGSLVEISLTVSPIKDSQGRVIGSSKIARDITAHKRTHEEIRRSETFVTSVVENLPNMIFVKDAKDLKFVRVNKAGEDLLGHSREVLIGKSDYDFFPKEEADYFTAIDRQVLKAGSLLDIPEEPIETKDQGRRILHTKKIPICDDTGEPQYLLGISEDITDRKRTENALRESEEQYRSIFENAAEGIFQTTLDGKYVAVNPALVRMYGYDSPEDMIATITDIASQLYVDPWCREVFIRLIQENEEVADFEALVYRKDGSFIWVSENVRARRDQAGLLIGYEGTAQDITERKLGEERLRKTLEEVRMLSGRLTTVQEEERTHIARELHDELGVRLTCLKIDLSRLQTVGSEETGASALKKVRGMIPSMIEQINETIASVQRLVTELRPIVLDDLGLVAAIEWQCQNFQKHTGIPCTCVTSAEDIEMEGGEATALFRICQEALTNITRHAHATAVTVKLESRCDFLHLVVADNGVGISDTKGSDRRSFGLLGMRERATLFGGEISIQSHPEQGTTVTVCLPRRQP